MARLAIWVIDHRSHDQQPEGHSIRVWDVVDELARPGPHYADFCALYEIWTDHTSCPGLEPEFIGFFGYRKYLWHPRWYTFLPSEIAPAHAHHWFKSKRAAFDVYRQWWALFDGQPIQELLAQHDIIQAAHFPLDGNLITDFARSRSAYDADALRDVLRKHGRSTTSTRIYPYLFITRWSVFDRMMRELEPLRQELEPLITARGSVNEDYKKRPMAYVMERLYSLWLENSGLDIKEVPLLHCWEMA